MKQLIIFDNHQIPRKHRGKTLILNCINKTPHYATDTHQSKSDKVSYTIREEPEKKRTLSNGRIWMFKETYTIWLRRKSYSLKTFEQSRAGDKH